MRVVALGAEPSLAAALNMTDWEVAYATEPEQAAEVIAGASVVLIGGGTEEGLRLAESMRALGVTLPAVVVGDTSSPQGARHPVLVRPFTLDELHLAVERAVAGAQQSSPPMPVVVETPPAERPLPPPPAKVEPKPPTAREAATKRHLEVAREPSGPVIGTPAALAPQAARAVTATARAAPPETVEPGSDPAPTSVRGQPGPREVPPAPAPPPSERRRAADRKLLRRSSRTVTPEPQENPVSSALRAAYESMRNIEKAIDDLPVLTDLRDLTQALLGEVVDLLTPETAGIYLPGPDGFRVWASHNFSNVEKTMAVQTHQPLFADLLVRHESVLIEPLDMAQQLAGGVGGARTNALLATPIEVNKKCVGVIVAGRGHFENEDLDRLAALADEAALGLGVALGLDRLRTKLT